jgi:hypothetical protein
MKKSFKDHQEEIMKNKKQSAFESGSGDVVITKSDAGPNENKVISVRDTRSAPSALTSPRFMARSQFS